VKVKGRYANATEEIKAEETIDGLRDIISGEEWVEGAD